MSNAPEPRWIAGPRTDLAASTLARIVHLAFPQARIPAMQPLADGLRNSNFKLELESPACTVVLRLYEHDPALCRKELALFKLVSGTVPVPEVLYVEAYGLPEEGIPPFALLRYVEGITFRDLRRDGGLTAIAQAAYSAGETLAAIGRFTFPKSGWLSANADGSFAVTTALLEGPDPAPRFVDQCLASPALPRRLTPELRDRVHTLVWSRARELAELDQYRQLVHCDFNKRNVLVHRKASGRWVVAAVLDWEFAVASTPLIDIANFLRYERSAHPLAEPHFSRGFQESGGVLPDGWRRLARVLDLTALCDSLTRDVLPPAVEAELVELVRATVEERDPALA